VDMLGSKRGRRAGRRMSMPEVRAAISDRQRQTWVGIGLVKPPPGGGSHYDVDDDVGVLVSVELQPEGQPVMARLGGLGEGGSNGVWRIPPLGSEVAVVVPGGDLDADACIVGVLASGGTPGELDGDTLVVRAPKIVIIADGAVEVGQAGLGPLDGLVHGSAIEPFTGQTYTALAATTSTIKAKK
jgi:hypothetical protein